MTRKLKLFGVIAVISLALTAVAASAATAAPVFHVETVPATITGEQTTTQEITTNSGVIRCTGATFHGVASIIETTTQEVKPTYTGCTAFGFLASTVASNECGYLFHLTAGGVSPFPATIDVVCPSGKAITVTSKFSNCVINIGPPPVSGLTGVTFTNSGSKTTRDLNASFNVSGIKYAQTGSNCGGAKANSSTAP